MSGTVVKDALTLLAMVAEPGCTVALRLRASTLNMPQRWWVFMAEPGWPVDVRYLLDAYEVIVYPTTEEAFEAHPYAHPARVDLGTYIP